MMQNKIFENCSQVTVKAYYNSMALTYAQNNDIDYEILYRLNPVEGSGISFDPDNNQILNLPENISSEVFESEYVELDYGFTIEYETVTSGVISSGTVINILKGDTVVETYTVV